MRKGEIRIGLLGIIFILLVIGWLLGKTSFWHIVALPFYAFGACFGLFLGVVALCVVIVLIGFIVSHFFGG